MKWIVILALFHRLCIIFKFVKNDRLIEHKEWGVSKVTYTKIVNNKDE
ncbi:hypothetical protein BACPEC_00119 [[Bacteroides] pectinophilus ATCC 43243]|uniref:Uncharacterized protein n=1 Tax=[Bacteroides] pectinophilus ATCC 43243 TaxID=483218 RepID=B7AN67_9FIRM|nr:hypothetical protein BACPEC_00119 [[Bacteroides] pectinophilus ATCC 43243]